MSDYWARRQVEDMYHYMQSAEDVSDRISSLYLKASRYLSRRADEIFEKYMTKHGLSEGEALRLINTLRDKASVDELLNKLKNGDKSESKKELLKQLEAPAYQARLERLRQLQNQLDQVMRDVYHQEKDFSTNFYTDLAQKAYYRNIYNIQQRADAAFRFNHVSTKQIDQVVNSHWSGENYSSRIWKNTRELAQDLKEELLINLVTGRTNREVAEIIANKFAQGASNARRLVRTESNFVSTELNFRAYEECGIEEYQYLATLDLKTSKICRSLDGKIFSVSGRLIGKNCPPMHPWCRSTTVSVIDRALIDKMQRSAIDPSTGKRIKVPRSMNYAQWYDKYVVKADQSDIIKSENTKEVVNVHSVGKIDREIYKCITDDIVTDEVIITDVQIRHIQDRHPNDYERFAAHFSEIVASPDYIVESSKPNTALILKEIQSENEVFKTVLRLVTSSDNPAYKNSIITFMKIDEKEWSRLLRNKKILYKKE